MNDGEIGYGKPPIHTRYKKGECGNLLGRPKRVPPTLEETLERVMHTLVEYQEGGQIKTASPMELTLKKLVASAINGDIEGAATLLKIRAQALKNGEGGPLIVYVHNALPDER